MNKENCALKLVDEIKQQMCLKEDIKKTKKEKYTITIDVFVQ